MVFLVLDVGVCHLCFSNSGFLMKCDRYLQESRVELAPTGEYREWNSLLQGNIASGTRSYRGISRVELAATGHLIFKKNLHLDVVM